MISGCGPPALGCRYGFEWFWAKTCREISRVRDRVCPLYLPGKCVNWVNFWISTISMIFLLKLMKRFSVKLNRSFSGALLLSLEWLDDQRWFSKLSTVSRRESSLYLISGKRGVAVQRCFGAVFFGCFLLKLVNQILDVLIFCVTKFGKTTCSLTMKPPISGPDMSFWLDSNTDG